MKNLILTHARPIFWLWCLPGAIFTVWCATWMEGSSVTVLYCLMIFWIIAGFWLINGLAWKARRPAFWALDENCDPEPLLDLCRTVLKQNPKSLFFRVYECYSLFLLGRLEEAEQSAALAAGNSRLWKRWGLLLVWSATLSEDDPQQKPAQETLENLSRCLHGKRRKTLEQVLTARRDLVLLPQAQEELEPRLLLALERASCTREQVAAHLALGIYYVQRQDKAAEEHLSFVLAHGNKLHARTQAQYLFCRVPGI